MSLHTHISISWLHMFIGVYVVYTLIIEYTYSLFFIKYLSNLNTTALQMNIWDGGRKERGKQTVKRFLKTELMEG